MSRSIWFFVVLLAACPRTAGPGDDDDAVANDDDVVADDDDAVSDAPSAPGVTIEPMSPEAGDSLLCFVAVDADGRRYQISVDPRPAVPEHGPMTRLVTDDGRRCFPDLMEEGIFVVYDMDGGVKVRRV